MPRPRAFTLVEILVVLAVIGTLMALLLPAVQSAREAARRTACANNLAQLALGLLAYETAHELLPPGSVNPAGPIANVPSGYHHSWIVQVLPHIDQPNLYANFNFDFGVYDASNSTATSTSLRVLLCPSGPTILRGSNYAGNHHHDEAPIDVTNTGLLFLNSDIRLDDIADGRAQTILLGERRASINELGWASGTSSTLRNGGLHFARNQATAPIPPGLVGGFGSYHPGGSEFAFADGRVGFLKSSIDRPAVLQPLLNRADGQVVDEASW